MKSLLLYTLLFLAAVAQAQDVCLPAPVAAFFLEQNEASKILKKQNDTLRAEISYYEERETIYHQTLAIEHDKTVVYDSLVELITEDKRSLSNEVAYLGKELTKEKGKQRVLSICSGVGAGVLIVLLILL